MQQSHHLLFGPFRLDPTIPRLWRGEEELDVPPRPLAVLSYLVTHPGQLVTKEELLKAVWAGTYVSDNVLRVHIRKLRAALGPEGSHYLQTVTRIGYRFLPDGTTEEEPAAEEDSSPFPLFVGRETELSHLQQWVNTAEQGQRQIGFVTGEPGIGKTTLVDAFLARVQATSRFRIGRGQCVEQYGAGEGYLPLLEALSRLGQEAGGKQLINVLQQYAPTWLRQLPALLSVEERSAFQAQSQGVTKDRMLRELAEAFEALTADRGIVLLLEDLHWSDSATLEFLSYIAQRREPARLCVIGTYRPADIIISEHPLRSLVQELQTRRQCELLPLELLSDEAVIAYITGRLGSPSISPALSRHVYQRTDGNALFMVNLVDYYLEHGWIEETNGQWAFRPGQDSREVPDGLRPLIEKQLERLSVKDRQVLDVASVAGIDFAVTAVAVGLKQDVDTLEEICERLASTGQLIEESGLAEWPDGSLSGRYRFRHTLYQQVLYDRLAEARRVRFHRTIGEHIEKSYGSQTSHVAAELAVHFE